MFTDRAFAVLRGTLTAVVGPSGSGRSALLLALGGWLRGVTGTVRLGSAPSAAAPVTSGHARPSPGSAPWSSPRAG